LDASLLRQRHFSDKAVLRQLTALLAIGNNCATLRYFIVGYINRIQGIGGRDKLQAI